MTTENCSNSLKEADTKLEHLAQHLLECSCCRIKYAADLMEIQQNIKEISYVLQNCRNIAKEMLQRCHAECRQVDKKQVETEQVETPCQVRSRETDDFLIHSKTKGKVLEDQKENPKCHKVLFCFRISLPRNQVEFSSNGSRKVGREQEINMKPSSVDEGTVKITKFPCTSTAPCVENEEDYDPCANSHDITEKDLQILSKIEAATLKADKELKGNQEHDKESGKRKWDKEKVGRDLKQEGGGKNIQKDNGKTEKDSKQEGGGKNIQRDNEKTEKVERDLKQEGGGKNIQKDNGRTEKDSKQEGDEKNIQKDDGRKSKSSRKLTDEFTTKGSVNLDSGRGAVDGDNAATAAAAAAASTIKPKRKTCHKKLKNNPFHRDRLALPSCVSPPPHFPPPQFHPPADEFEEVKCRKPRKSKPCRKKTVIGEIKKKSKEISREESTSKGEVKEETNQEVTEETVQEVLEETQQGVIEETEQEVTEETKKEADRSVEEIKPETETGEKRIEEVKRRMSEAKAGKGSTQDEKPKKLGPSVPRNRKPCMRRVQRPCKKKVSETSISLLPPLIPPLQRGLPSISPKDIPEVKRQTLMAEETKRAIKRERCKGRLVNKAKNK